MNSKTNNEDPTNVLSSLQEITKVLKQINQKIHVAVLSNDFNLFSRDCLM